MTITRRDYVKQVMGVAAGVALPGLTGGRSVLAMRGAGAEDITGKGSLKARAAARGMLAGCAVNAELFRQDEKFRNLLAEQYSILVPENCLKWNILRPTPDTYSFTDADSLVAFAETHGMKVRGHNFVWHEALPKWFASTVTKENARKFLVDHITTVGGRYKGKIHSWDVVNEAIWMKDGRADGMRSSSPWFEMLGPEYIDIAFRTAREVDPKALLTYNEYGIEYDTEEEGRKRVATLALLRRMKAANVPLDALGIQSHLHADGKTDFGKGIHELMDGARALGLQVFVTEMDVNDDKVTSDDIAQRDQIVADVYHDYLTTALRGPEVKAVLTWGASDRNTWLNHGTKFRPLHPDRLQRPLPFDVDYAPKKAFFAMRDSFDGAKKR
ncbi:endo-1,4-beta-xylanase [Edaphobacter aggregans]|uniref:Beta-xylanase n=1 Tax=Edaphobacter aggregans TaxID=570835 RepID=A0A3R9PBB3_9BACT|nr:endo-1,4-beta-xylanase [Edaphobacter aggregans]RSL17868.1 endo-1,4-beta-xylanase [Edaphobacter aggregans]